MVALLLLAGGTAATRMIGDSAAGTALAAAGIAHAAAAAALVPGVTGPARLLAGGSAAVGATVLALALVRSGPFFAGVLVAATLGLAAGALAASGAPTTHIASALAAVAVLFGAFVPGLAFKLGGLRLPALPRNADELQEEIEPFPAEDVLARSLVADSYLAGFFVAVGAVCAATVSVLALARDGGWGPTAMAADLAVLLLLHARDIGGLRQRLALLLPGALGLGLLAARTGWDAEPGTRLVVFVLLLLAATGLCATAWTVPGHAAAALLGPGRGPAALARGARAAAARAPGVRLLRGDARPGGLTRPPHPPHPLVLHRPPHPAPAAPRRTTACSPDGTRCRPTCS